MKTAFLYAGQGSQRVGMGRDLYAASPAFRKAFDAAELDFDLHALCFDGPQETLNQTQYTQPCMVAFACGVTAALMVLDWYDALGDWNEESLAALRHSLDGTELEGYLGTTLNQAIDIFNGVGGFDIISSNDYPDGIWLDDIQGWLSEGKPVMICWNDWGGHWQTIIGYDTMGTENENDDVFLVADSYDTTDHNQDGYGIYPAERLMYNFTMYGAFPESEGGSDMLFLVASPSAK